MITQLWMRANRPPCEIRGRIGSQKRALKPLLEIRGGVEFVVSRPPEGLDELERRGIWAGPAILQDLALLEIQRRRLMIDLADIELGNRQILRDLGLTGTAPSSADPQKVSSGTNEFGTIATWHSQRLEAR
jgi:hypothetical protein